MKLTETLTLIFKVHFSILLLVKWSQFWRMAEWPWAKHEWSSVPGGTLPPSVLLVCTSIVSWAAQ